MITQAAINIQGNGHTFRYILRYEPSEIWRGLTHLEWAREGDDLYLMDSVESQSRGRLIRRGSVWEGEWGWADGSGDGIPWDEAEDIPSYNEAQVQIIFPEYSVDTYERGVKYALTANTWISGTCVWLGGWLVDRLDSLALDGGPRHMGGTSYSEQQSFPVADPWDLVYSDEWAQWRKEACGEPEGTNAVGSILCLTLYPVRENEEGQWVMLDGYTGGSCGINIDIDGDGYMGLDVSFDRTEGTFESSLHLNEAYQGDLRTYMKETYGEDVGSIRWELVYRDQDNIYKLYTYEDSDDNLEVTHIFSGVSFSTWEDWSEGRFFQGGLSVLSPSGSEILSTLSRQIPADQMMFAHLVESSMPHSINLDSIDMNIYNINAVNKIQNQVVQLDNPWSSKSGIIQPVFFQARETASLVIHPAVTEVISLNLDAYKSTVSSFILQLEGVKFPELGRTGRGVLFRIAGSLLPGEASSGTYYILNESGESVTSGNYTYSA